MKRDLRSLAARKWDLLVVGGGVHGAFVAREGALRGLSVALVEKGDFVSETSSQSQKIVHNGLRYLQHGDLVRLRRSVRERSALMKIAPHLVRPMPVLVPTYSRLRKRLLAVAMGIHDLAGCDRNRGIPEERRIPRGRTVTPAECRELFPDADPRGLTGGALWYDGQITDTERFVLALLHDVSRREGAVANYAEVTGFSREGGRITGAVVRDRRGGPELHLRSSLIVNAAGPWVRTVCRLAGLGGPPPPLLSRTFVLVVKRRLVGEVAVGLPARTSFADPDEFIPRQERYFFITPWGDSTLLGSAHLPAAGAPGDRSVSREEIGRFLADVNASCPAWSVGMEEVVAVYRGLLPTVSVDTRSGGIQVEKRQRIWDHRRHDGVEGMVSVIGVKYTTARDAAARAVALAGKKLRRRLRPAPGAAVAVCGGELGGVEDIVARVSGERGVPERSLLRRLAAAHGSTWRDVLRHDRSGAEGPEWIHPSSPVLAAEILHGIRDEMAFTLADIVLRRTAIGATGHPGRPVLEAAARIAARELGWDKARVQEEIADTEKALSF